MTRTPLSPVVAAVLLASLAAALGGDDLERGEKLFTSRCVRCHGPRADGKGPGAKVLKNPPRDLTAGVFKFRTTFAPGMPTDDDLIRTIGDGLPAYGMPPFDDISVEDRRAIIAYVKTLVKQGLIDRYRAAAEKEGSKFDPEEAARAAEERLRPGVPVVVPPEPGGNDEGAVERGRKLFTDPKRFLCWTCHGAEGKGDGPEADKLKDDGGFTIRPRDLTKQKTFRRSGWTPEDTVRRILTGIPGTPMPANPQAAGTPEGAREVWDIARFVESISSSEK